MDNKGQALNSFFDRYAETFNKAIRGEAPDVEETAAAFSDCFIKASPAHVICGKNDQQQFRNIIPQGYAFFIMVLELMPRRSFQREPQSWTIFTP